MRDFYFWLKENDLPNWLGLLFTVIFWPLVLYLWSKRKYSNISNLTVSLEKGEITISGNPTIPSIKLTFINSSNTTIFITNLRIKNNKNHFVIHPDSSRDFYSGYYELKFHDGSTMFNLDNKTLKSNDSAFTAIGVTKIPGIAFFKYKSNYLRRFFNSPKYFILQYTALVGNKRYLIKTIF